MGLGYLDAMSLDGPDMLNGPSTPLRRAFFLTLGAVVMVAAAWQVAPVAGAPIAMTAALYGWIAARMTRQEPAAKQAPSPAIPAPVAPEPATPAAAAAKDPNAVLRHDLRGLLSPALMVSDRLMAHGDPAVRRAGEVVVKTVQRLTDRLEETRTTPEVRK
jgi:hypothetical protein